MGNKQSSTSERNLTCNFKRLALVFSNELFDCGLEEREGNDIDIKNIKEVLEKLNFDVVVLKDLTVQEISRWRNYYSALDYTDFDSFVLIVLTHGSSEGILYASDSMYYTHQIWSPFVKNKTMKNTQKFFIFQACRGKEEEMKIKCLEGDMDGLQQTFASKHKESTNMRIVPHTPHCLLAFSTFEDHVSKRNLNEGTLFIRTLCNNLTTAMNKETNLDILDILTMTNCDVMEYVTDTETGQTPVFISFLHHTTFSTPNQGQNIAIDCSSELDVARETMKNDGLGSFSQTTYKNDGHMFGRILYDTEFKKMAEKLRRTLQFHELKFECLEIEDARIAELLWPISDTMELKNVDCLVMIILAEMCEIRHKSHERIYAKLTSNASKHLDNKIPINEFWQTFTASKCQYLRKKPKLFFFIDTLERCDKNEIQKTFSDQSNYNSHRAYQRINEHADFLWVYVYGKQMYDKLMLNKLCKSTDQELLKLITEAMREAEKNHTTGKCSHFESTLRYGAHLHPINDKQKLPKNKIQIQPLQIVKQEIEPHNAATASVDDMVQNSPDIEEWQTVKRGAKSKSTKKSPRNLHTQKNQFQKIAPHSSSEWIGSKYELNYVSGDILEDCKTLSVCYFVAADFEMKSNFAQKVHDKLQYNVSVLKKQRKKKGEVVVDPLGDSNYIFHLLNAEFSDDSPTMLDTKSCLRELKQNCTDFGVTQLAIPYTGNDGISWKFIQRFLRETFANSNISVNVYNKPVTDAPSLQNHSQSQKNVTTSVSKESRIDETPRNTVNPPQNGKSSTQQNNQKIKQSNKTSKKKKNKKITK